MDTGTINAWMDALEPSSPGRPQPVSDAKSPEKTSGSLERPADPDNARKQDEEGVNTTSAPQKKRRLESQGGLVDANVTPRRRSIPNSTASLSDSEAGSLSSASWTRRQLMQLRLSKTGIEYTPLRERSVPAAAKALLMAIKKISHCHEILPAALKSTIMQDQELTTESLEGSEWRFSFRPDHERDDLPGQIPSITEMKKVLINAIECSNFRHEEASWNALVHLQLLRLILNNDVGQQYDDFNAIPCNTEPPHREFLPISSLDQMMNTGICIYATIDQDPELETAIETFCRTTPTLSVNFTDCYALQFRPIVIRIKTTQPGIRAWQKTRLQMGAWFAAQWAFLRWGVRQKLLRQRVAQGVNAPEDEEDTVNQEALEALSRLGFIPGILVDGHQWLLVISTYDNGMTTIWADLLFGTTQSLMTIYAVVAGVRELMAWGRDTYLPWFKENVLTLGDA